MKESYPENCEEPLCAFCVSAAFFIRGDTTAEKVQTAPSGRHQFSFTIPSYSGRRLGRFKRNQSSANLFLTIADLFSRFKKRRYLSLKEILDIIQNVWQPPELLAFRRSDSDMERSSNKTSLQETRSPVPQRRRLSVPETIMRKHNLALERTTFQETKHPHWDKEVECSSDPNLTRKKDFNVVRKSTLLRRLWGDSTKPKLSGSFQEWQHSYKKLSSTQSLNSNHSSPEHLPRKVDPISPRRKFSSSPIRLPSKSFYDDQSAFNSPKRKTPVIRNSSLKSLSKTSHSQESTNKYTCSSFTNVSDTNSDSAYSNSISNFTSSLSSRTNTKKFQIDENTNRSNSHLQETAVQTADVANLNVISNVSLSQATLDVIFKEVMKDVNKQSPGNINISSATVISDEKAGLTIDKLPSFFFDMHSDSPLDPPLDLDNLIISKTRAGSPYSKPTDICQPAVPRFSAVPRTFSMEVNTSEEDKEESDSVSYVDSLEDFSSPRALRRNFSDIAQLLPEGKNDSYSKKSSTFFVPIQVDNEREAKTVSESLPLRVRERLIERQQRREEKSRQHRNSSESTTNSISVIKSTLNFGNYLPKKRTKPVLPSIASLKRTSSKDKRSELESRKRIPHISKSKDNKATQNLSTNGNEFYLASEEANAPRRIEILEIMEYVEISSDKNKRSKIPVPVSGNINKKTDFNKPTYLDLDNHVLDPKVDQLIANILIDSLNHDKEAASYQDLQNANCLEDASSRTNGKNYSQKFEMIPEKIQKQELSKNYNLKGIEKDFRQRNLSSVPKGWVTVYTVQKELETPESTSDEGKKYLMTDTNAEEVADAVREKHVARDVSNYDNHNDVFIPSSRHETPTFGSTLFHNSLNKFETRHKEPTDRKGEQRKHSLGQWSVTISGSNSYGQMTPDVEMRLKFPKKYRTSSNSSMEKENNQTSKFNFPKIDQKLTDYERRYSKGKQEGEESLPKIQTGRHRLKKRESSGILMTPSVIIPRQTKTSTSRYHFSRPRESYSLPEVPSILDERQYFEIMRHIPNILAVTGRSISPERRSFEER